MNLPYSFLTLGQLLAQLAGLVALGFLELGLEAVA